MRTIFLHDSWRIAIAIAIALEKEYLEFKFTVGHGENIDFAVLCASEDVSDEMFSRMKDFAKGFDYALRYNYK